MTPVDLDRLKGAFDQSVDLALPQLVYYGLWTCQVVSQNEDGTLDLQPAVSFIPSQKNIKIRSDSPNEQITVNPGTEVLLGWENADPSVPYAGLWSSGSPGGLQSKTVTAAQKLAFVAPQVALGPGTPTLGVARLNDPVASNTSMLAWISAITAAVNTLSGGAPIPPPVGLGNVSGASTAVQAS